MSALLQSVTQTSNEWFSSCSMTALAGLSAPRHKSNLINCKSNDISLIVPSGWCLNSPFSLYVIVPAAPSDFLQGLFHGTWEGGGRSKHEGDGPGAIILLYSNVSIFNHLKRLQHHCISPEDGQNNSISSTIISDKSENQPMQLTLNKTQSNLEVKLLRQTALLVQLDFNVF